MNCTDEELYEGMRQDNESYLETLAEGNREWEDDV